MFGGPVHCCLFVRLYVKPSGCKKDDSGAEQGRADFLIKSNSNEFPIMWPESLSESVKDNHHCYCRQQVSIHHNISVYHCLQSRDLP